MLVADVERKASLPHWRRINRRKTKPIFAFGRRRRANLMLLSKHGAELKANVSRANSPEPGGYFSGARRCRRRHSLLVSSKQRRKFYPDPASRFQPEGPHGPSCIIDPRQFQWTDSQWPGPAATGLKGQIIYEMHIGTFTKEGTWRAATEQLAELARIGITVVEMMPIADFPGNSAGVTTG